ncbi:hypothetical protein NM688_g3563 [Phlebia brevispora]|uniref:Uncharacterized protein n=1 Tax=Phlebia brevispora TaxID=194682 RepID=A0ACC1T5E2_9APHY|nr:hypothetical protein NM688_g3563 [Phlebia brevispora]
MDLYSTAQNVIQILQTVYEKYQEYRESDETIRAASDRLEAVDVRLDLFERCLKHQQADLTDKQRKILQKSLDRVGNLLSQLGEQLPAKSTIVAKITWVGWKRHQVEGVVEELRTWVDDTQGTFFIVDLEKRLRQAGLNNDDKLRQRLFDTGDHTFAGAWTLSNRINSLIHDVPHLPKSSFTLPTKLGEQMVGEYQARAVYLEAHYIEEGDERTKQDQIRSCERLASVFRSSDVDLSALHLLPASGIIEDYEFDRCYIVYELPFSCPVSPSMPTLSHILERQVRITLEDRIRIALEAAVAVFSVHAAGWVHKNIRSDNILINTHVAKGSKAAATVETAYLVGFQSTRPRVEGSEQRPELDPVKRLYQHPERQGGRDTRVKRFDIRHDMYSLGAVLVEIGYRKTLQEIFFPKARPSGNEPTLNEANDNHKRLVDYAHRLSDKMGTKYADAALVCLTQTTEQQTSPELREEFYRSVLQPLKEIYEGLKGRQRNTEL